VSLLSVLGSAVRAELAHPDQARCDAVRIVGRGEALWRVRVELFADDGDVNHRIGASAVALEQLLPEDDGETLPGMGGDHGVDEGIGDARFPVVGFLFWVRADAVGEAAERCPTSIDEWLIAPASRCRAHARRSGSSPTHNDTTTNR
jgi:hypothetical protein